MTNTNRSMLVNPQFDGGPFYWEGGPVGIILIHGFTATVREVRLLADRLKEEGFTIGGPLLPGHYTQPTDLNKVHWQDWIAAGEAMYQKMATQCQSVIVGGESTGALVALYLASRHPEITGILTYAPALRINLKLFELFLLRLLAPFVPYVSKGSLDSSSQWQGYPVNPLKGTLQLLKLQHEIIERLPGIRQPILIVQGRLDTTVHPSVPDTIESQIGSAVKEKYWMDHSAHCVLLDQEIDEVTQLTLRFIRHIHSN